jgi:hypothetical protein
MSFDWYNWCRSLMVWFFCLYHYNLHLGLCIVYTQTPQHKQNIEAGPNLRRNVPLLWRDNLLSLRAVKWGNWSEWWCWESLHWSHAMGTCVSLLIYACVCLIIPCSMSFSYFYCHHLPIIIIMTSHEGGFLWACKWQFFSNSIWFSFRLLHTLVMESMLLGAIVIKNKCLFVPSLDEMTHRVMTQEPFQRNLQI